MKGRRHALIFWPMAAILAAVLCIAAPADALPVPDLENWVNDYADMISPEAEDRIENMLSDLEKADTTEIVVVTVPSLEGETIETFSLRIGEEWQIGKEGLDNGALLVVSRKDRKIRIEVGYGLEAPLTDLAAGRIIRNIISPHFKAGRFDRGFIEGVDAMIGVVRGEFSTDDLKKTPSPVKDDCLEFCVVAFILGFLLIGRAGLTMGLAASVLSIPVGLFIYKESLTIALMMFFGGVCGSLFIPYFYYLAGVETRDGKLDWTGSSLSSGSGGFLGGGGGFGGGGASGGW